MYTTMVLLVGVALTLVSVPLRGGRLRALGGLELRHGVWLAAAVTAQVSMAAWSDSWVPRAVVVGTMIVTIAVLWQNRTLSGIPLMMWGGMANLTAIALNGGVMPAWSWAWEASGAPQLTPGQFANARPDDAATALILGDVIPMPPWLAGSAPFSIGDVLLMVGFGLLVHSTCGCGRTRRGAQPRQAAPLVGSAGVTDR